jgi:FlaA1/EpsC-like NDP-sugar epimerase
VLRAVAQGESTAVVAVRFGNVLGSDGSVLPIFKWQMARGGPITITDLDASRYFMLPSEAAQLVIQAGLMGKGGEVFFLDMGEPILISDLAKNLIRLAGMGPGRDVPLEVMGLRPGERLREELVMANEELLPTPPTRKFACSTTTTSTPPTSGVTSRSSAAGFRAGIASALSRSCARCRPDTHDPMTEAAGCWSP